MGTKRQIGIRDTYRSIEAHYHELTDPDHQFLREYFENSKAAIQRSGCGSFIHWCVVPWPEADKLAIIDDGPGMTAVQLFELMGDLSASLIVADKFGTQFGCGAKISAIPRNHAGIIVRSWVDGISSTICLDVEKNGDKYEANVDYYSGTVPITNRQHGTIAIFLGHALNQNTTFDYDGGRVQRYLTEKYLDLPNQISYRDIVKVDTAIRPYRHYLNKWSADSGSLSLTKATLDWWVLKPGEYHEGGIHPHTAILLVKDGEVYERWTRSHDLAKFGLTNLHGKVVLAINADAYANVSRTQLLVSSDTGAKRLPTDVWAKEFEAKLPPAIAKLREKPSIQSYVDNPQLVELINFLSKDNDGIRLQSKRTVQVLLQSSQVVRVKIINGNTVEIRSKGKKRSGPGPRPGPAPGPGPGRKRTTAPIVGVGRNRWTTGTVAKRTTNQKIPLPDVLFKTPQAVPELTKMFATYQLGPNRCYVNKQHQMYRFLCQLSRKTNAKRRIPLAVDTLSEIVEQIITHTLCEAVVIMKVIKPSGVLRQFLEEPDNFDLHATGVVQRAIEEVKKLVMAVK